jgi:deoxyribodipyrimidine photo-lyase
MVNPKRVRVLQQGKAAPGPVLYWMSRDQRVQDNWALLFAQELALQRRAPLVVAFCLVRGFLGATRRQYRFMLQGLAEVEESLAAKGIPFCLLTGAPQEELPALVRKHSIGQLVTDFDPLRIRREWKAAVGKRIHIPFYEVDAHNIVPCWQASPKTEWGAYTLRPKIQRALPEFLERFPPLRKHPFAWAETVPVDWERAAGFPDVNEGVTAVDWLEPGEKAARRMLRRFLEAKLADYPDKRNDPNQDGQSHLSPYLHFGQIAAQRVALELEESSAPRLASAAFLEELIVRRELSDNFCFYNPHYDSVAGFPPWAQTTLGAHRRDPRPYLYSREELERAETHDDLWNAAQLEMVQRGKMHGYLRMYWAKKILEWTETPEQALEIAIALNDKYELDGRDPNGYAGIAWSIGGVHDRAWGDRPVFGKIRYMSYNGSKGKFDVRAYVRKYATPAEV